VLTPLLSTKLAGSSLPYWAPTELEKCPYGRLVRAICPGDPPSAAYDALHSEEIAHALTLNGDRRREWIAGRLCLAQAVGQLSTARIPLLQLPSGGPRVPVGLAGSISHKGPLTVAVAAISTLGIGIDVECAEDGDERLAGRVLTSRERSALADLDNAGAALALAVHFAAKEAIYKAASAAEQPAIDFEDVELVTSPPRLMKPREWVAATGQVRGMPVGMRVALFLDGRWVIAVACRG
jgi:enterobactin synthetase component D